MEKERGNKERRLGRWEEQEERGRKNRGRERSEEREGGERVCV